MALSDRSRFSCIRPVRAMFLVLILCSAGIDPAGAQNLSSGSVDGVVTDESGAALPGVAVTASSPALQVKQVATVTDSEGRYRFLDLPRGTYQIDFDLGGFQSYRRAGLEVAVGFAARVNAQLKIGSLAETITVSGASPVVDLTTTRGGTTISSDLLITELPGSKTLADVISLSAGLQSTAGEVAGSLGLTGRPRFTAYGLQSGNTNITMMVDGFQIIANYPVPDTGATDEVDVKTFGNTADIKEMGPAMNLVFKSGGNDFHGSISEAFMKQPSDNVDAALLARGFVVGARQKYFDDIGGDLGGRLVRDKLWFFGSYRKRYSKTSQPGLVLNAGPDGRYLTGDEPPAFPKLTGQNIDGKLSYQMTPKYQINGFIARDQTTNEAEIQIAPFGAVVDFAHTPWESTDPFNWLPYARKVEVRGTPAGNLLFDAALGKSGYKLYYDIQPESFNKPTSYNLRTLLLTGANIPHISDFNFWTVNAHMTYTPSSFLGGNHQFKVGYYLGRRDNAGGRQVSPAGDYSLEFDTVNGVPDTGVQFEARNAPVDPTEWDDGYSGYAMDQWRVGGRVTLNLGLRWDGQHSFVPEQSREAGAFAAAVTFARVDVYKSHRLAPRAAVAWDLTGKGHSVLKFTYGRFVPEQSLAGAFDKNGAFVTTYRWHDLNNNKLYDPGEVNLSTAAGSPDFISTTSPANNILNPDMKLPYVHEITVAFERELTSSTAVRGLFLYRRNGSQTASINVLRPYSAFNIPIVRTDPGPDGTLGTRDDAGPVTIWDYDPAYRGAAFQGNQVVNRPDGRNDSNQAYEVAMNRRLSNRWSMTSSFTLNKAHNYVVSIPQSPNDDYFPLDTSKNWTYKLSGNWNGPRDIVVGAIVEAFSGPQGTRTYVFRAAGENGGTPLRQLTTVNLRLGPTNAESEPNYAQFNLRLGKKFHFGSRTLQTSVDALNVTNTNAIKNATYVSGPQFGNVTNAVPSRQLRGDIKLLF
jgi:hypothetical protein